MKRILLAALTFFTFTLCEGQYTVLYNFNAPNGAYPAGSLTFSGNKFYGMSQDGGAKGIGTIFSVDTNGSGFKDLHDFDTAKGEYVQGSLALVGRKLYGMTYQGGAHGVGIIFSIDTNGSGYKDLVDFNFTNGNSPNGSLTLSGNKLYGVTYSGGVHSKGNIFSIDTNGNGFKDLFDFNGINGSSPEDAQLAVSGGKLFGMTQYGGNHDSGCVFTIDTVGKNYKDLLDFNVANGSKPYATSLIISGDVLYGMSTHGGAHDSGCIFSIDTNGSAYSDLFDFNSKSGAIPESGITLIGSSLFGTTFIGGANNAGCIFTVGTNGSKYTDLFDFDGTNGSEPWNMTLTNSGNILYGTASFGGANNEGVIFSFKDFSLGINNLSPTTSSINLYPNPSTGQFTIKSSVLSGNPDSYRESVEVYNVLGEQVYSQVIVRSSSFIVDLSNQPNGIYLYRVIGDSGELIGEGKLVIQK